MKKPLFLISTALLMIGLSTPSHAGDSTIFGTMLGAGVGGLLGSKIGKGEGQLAATGAGVFLGGLMGNNIGQSLDRGNAAYYNGSSSYYTPTYNTYSSYEETYRPRRTYVAPYEYYDGSNVNDVVYARPGAVEYYSPRQTVLVEGGYVQVMPGNDDNSFGRHEGRRGKRQHCREFTQTVRIDGRTHESYGTACLRPDGSWQIEQ